MFGRSVVERVLLGVREIPTYELARILSLEGLVK